MIPLAFPGRPRALLRAVVLATALVGHGAAAADSSAWQHNGNSSARLIAGAPNASLRGAALRAGLEIKLATGWNTYWRYPGDAGVPPRFDFSGSRNVKDVRILWPAPARFVEDGVASIGYTRDVILPLRIVPVSPDAPTVLRLKLDYAVCEKLCVPAQAELELNLQGGGTFEPRLAASEARVPQRSHVGAQGELAIVRVFRKSGPKPQVLVDVRAPTAAAQVDLFAEGPDSGWSLPLPEPVPGAPPGLRRFSFAIEGAPPGAESAGAELLLTAVADDRAIEVPFRLD